MNLFFLDKDSRFFVVQSRESLTIHICKTQFCSAVGFETYNSCNTGIQSLPLSSCCGQLFPDFPLQEAFETCIAIFISSNTFHFLKEYKKNTSLKVLIKSSTTRHLRLAAATFVIPISEIAGPCLFSSMQLLLLQGN